MAFNTDYIKGMPPVTKNLIFINILIFLVMALIPEEKALIIDKYCDLFYFQAPWFKPYQIFTYMFLHANLTHIFFNMFALFMFGPLIERVLGSKRFLFYYISCGIGAALVQEGVGYAITMLTDSPIILQSIYLTRTIGASGAIYGVLLAFGFIFPERQIFLLIPPMPIKAKWLVIGYGALELIQTLTPRFGDNVAHLCHLGGMLIGLIMLYMWKKKGLFDGIY